MEIRDRQSDEWTQRIVFNKVQISKHGNPQREEEGSRFSAENNRARHVQIIDPPKRGHAPRREVNGASPRWRDKPPPNLSPIHEKKH